MSYQTAGCPDEVDSVTLEKERAQQEYAAKDGVSYVETNHERSIFDYQTPHLANTPGANQDAVMKQENVVEELQPQQIGWVQETPEGPELHESAVEQVEMDETVTAE